MPFAPYGFIISYLNTQVINLAPVHISEAALKKSYQNFSIANLDQSDNFLSHQEPIVTEHNAAHE